MARCGNSLLRHQHGIADGALFALRQTGFRAGGGDGFINDLGMARCGNSLLRRQHGIADGAVFALRQARFCTSGGDGFINDLGMARCGNDLLHHQHGIADGTMFALRQARFCTSGGDGFINDLGVGQHFDGLLRRDDISARDAAHTGSETGFRAGGGHYRDDLQRVNGQRQGRGFQGDLDIVLRGGVHNGHCDVLRHRLVRVCLHMQRQQLRFCLQLRANVCEYHRTAGGFGICHDQLARCGLHGGAVRTLQNGVVVVHLQLQRRQMAVGRHSQRQIKAVSGADMLHRRI